MLAPPSDDDMKLWMKRLVEIPVPHLPTTKLKIDSNGYVLKKGENDWEPLIVHEDCCPDVIICCSYENIFVSMVALIIHFNPFFVANGPIHRIRFLTFFNVF
uniref:Uncharacterized protein n=1 Tax=Caenorhabditis japonica TaxID=281687 RepID=A0A8R1DU92_CAEJA